MDFKTVEDIDGGIIIKDVVSFELPHIFDCGQCFRWNRQENGSYIGTAFNKVIEVLKKDSDVIIYNTDKEEFFSLWLDYFDLKRDYKEIKNRFSEDPLLKTAVQFGYGIRLLQQEPFELLISFIISSNNRIPMIKRCIENISRQFGNKIIYNGETYYSFPDINSLKKASEEELKACGAGFRAKYIFNTVQDICNKGLEADLQVIRSLTDDECHLELQKFSGVGPKVADCIMLFSMNKYSAFPVDVWVKRAMQHFYLAPDVSLKGIRKYGRDKFGNLSGFAQQYLFYYARETNIKL